MFNKLFKPKKEDICPNCGTACFATDVLCPNCGKNLDELFEQLPSLDVPPFSLTKFIKQLFVILMSILIPVVTATLAVQILFAYGSLSDSGRFIQWSSWGSPAESVIKILGFCDHALCVQTTNNKIFGVSTYHCDESSRPCWKQLEQPVIEEPYFGSCWFRFTEKNPPKRVLQMIRTNSCGSGGAIQTDYALLADGNIWVWEHTVTDLQGLQWFVLAIPVAGISFIIGIVVVLIFAPIIWKKWAMMMP